MNRSFQLLCLVFLLALGLTAYGQKVTMNEIYSRGVAPNLDWIELYNADTLQMDISGYKIYDNGGKAGTKPKKVFDAGTVIPAKGVFVIVTDGSGTSDFGLSSGGETVWLENAAGTVIDTIAFAAMDTTQTYGRYPDGNGAWKLLNKITRGTQNVIVVMNEIYSRGTPTNLDWIELYNTSTSSINLNGYKIYDSGGKGGTKPKKAFDGTSIIPAKGYLVVVTDGSGASDFGLSSGGEAVWLEDSSATVIDTVAFKAMDTLQTYGRLPDGGAWRLLNKITRGASNEAGTAVEPMEGEIPTSISLAQNFPNPFNPTTTIRFALPSAMRVRLTVFNLLGQEVSRLAEGQFAAGVHEVAFVANQLPSGMYLYRLDAERFFETRSMILLK